MMRIRRYCARGLAAIDLVVELLARGCGRTRALKGLADMLVDETHSSQMCHQSSANAPN